MLLPAAYGILETGITGTVTTVTTVDEPDAAPVKTDEDITGEDLAGDDAAFATGQTVV